jgi:hypothetical protein
MLSDRGNMIKERLEIWKKNKLLLTGFTGKNKKLMDVIINAQQSRADSYDKGPSNLNTSILVEACKELIYNKTENQYLFHGIAYTFDVDIGKISLGHTFDISVDKEGPQEKIEDEIIGILALAHVYDIPVYPNKIEIEPELARYHRKMFTEGFSAPDSKGNRVRIRLNKTPGKPINKAIDLKGDSVLQFHSPADFSLIRDTILKEFSELSSAQKVLSNLSYAVDGLKILLDSDKRNENKLQRWITENPILFGTEYQQIIPKYQLGSEYEMDYALKRHSGLIDLVEIESSNLNLFNRNGEPSKYLIIAEQQVLDWLEWIESHGEYARYRLPDLYSPKAFIVIGRSIQLDVNLKAKLRRRNLLFRGQIEILTYDDFLTRTSNLQKQLTSLQENK